MKNQSKATEFCNLVRKRSEENMKAISILDNEGLYGQVMSILRQDLDSMVRCIYLLFQPLSERERLIDLTLMGERWKKPNGRTITDKDMVEIANELQGWTKSVYKFGCAFIHLSNLHDYNSNDLLVEPGSPEEQDIKQHLKHYHGYDMNQDLTFNSIKPYLHPVSAKIQANLEFYMNYVKENKDLS